MRIAPFLMLCVLALQSSAAASQWKPKCDPARSEDYIPANLDDSLVQLYCLLEPETIQKMANGSEDEMVRYHHGLGTGLRNSWGLWTKSRLYVYFYDLGLRHPDDMSGVILKSFWRRLNDQPLDVEGQILRYQAYWLAHQEPPPLLCPNGSNQQWSSQTSDGEYPDEVVVTFFAKCPAAGWFKYQKASGGWKPIEGEPSYSGGPVVERIQ